MAQKMRNPKWDRTKYCRFYKEVGLATNICYQTKEEIEYLIRKGHLGEFVHNERSQQQQQYQC